MQKNHVNANSQIIGEPMKKKKQNGQEEILEDIMNNYFSELKCNTTY